jgi:hypothetical protein
MVVLIMNTDSGLADQDLSMEAQSAFQYLNKIRIESGMRPFAWNPILQQSALNHAIYLTKNNIISHLELKGYPYFTGDNPGERALVQGYDVRNVTENHSVGGNDPLESVDGLMGAIYHRFGFLDFTKNEIGIALSESRHGFNIVYNLGNEQLNQFCKYAIDTGEGPFYQGICKQTNKVPVNKVDALEYATAKENPPLVVWPADSATEISPVFYEEIPDPLPGIAVSGYPVSIQFNPAFFPLARLLQFRLFKLNGEEVTEIKAVHLLQKRNDPHHKLAEHEFALFPLNRFEWGTRYQAFVEYQHGKENGKKSWTFTTRRLPYPVFVVEANGNSLFLVPDRTYAIYIPPGDHYPYIEQLSVESPYTVHVAVNWEDKNTILLKMTGQRCQSVLMQLNGNRSFTVNLSRSDNLNRDHHYPKVSNSVCVQ